MMVKRYYYTIDGKEFGPFEADELREKNLPAETIIRMESTISETSFSDFLKSIVAKDGGENVKIEEDSDFHLYAQDK